MEQKYKYEALKSLSAADYNRENDDSTNWLETQFLNEAVNFVKDSEDGIIRIIRTAPDDDERPAIRSIAVPYKEIRNLSQKEILEEIARRFTDE